MNKFVQNLFSVLLPFYPLFAWLFFSLTHASYYLQQFLTFFLLAIALYILPKSRKLPGYLLCFMVFTAYHLYSVYTNNLIPRNSNGFTFMFFDMNVFACIIFFILENTNFEEWFIKRMNRFIFYIVILTLLVSLLQIRDVTFFISPEVTSSEDMAFFLEGGRNYSIYSWINLNSIGITFPILIAVLINAYEEEKVAYILIIFSAIVVSFLTKTRYMMISAIIVLSQLLFTSKFTLKKKLSSLFILVAGIVLLVGVSSALGVDINKIVDERILEKGTDLRESASSAGARITSFNVFIIKFPEHPWFGVGPHTRDDVLTLLDGIPIIHIGYLSYLYYYGIIGCFFFFLTLYFLLRDAWFVGKRHKFWGSFYGLLAFCLANLTFLYFDLSESGIIIAAIYSRFYRQNHTEELETIELNSLVNS